MSAAENKACVHRFLEEIFNRKNVDAAAHLASASVAAQFDRASAIFELLSAFPDFELTVEALLNDGEWVVCRSSWHATHLGTYLHLPPTGKRVSGRRTDTFRVVSGTILDVRQHWDALGLVQQLGAARASSPGELPAAYEEPILASEEIQGNVIPGFHARFQTLLFVRFVVPEQAQAWLRTLAPRITTLADMYRSHAARAPEDARRVLVNIVFSYPGLRKLTAEAAFFTDPAFKEGMPQRSVLLGDPTDPRARGYCRNWLVGGPGAIPDACVLLASEAAESLGPFVSRLVYELPPGVQLMYEQPAAANAPPRHEYEQFGFRDNISQPGVRGRLSVAPDEPFQARHDPSNPHEGKPGQHMIWPGEFVFGYPAQDPLSKLKPGVVANAGPAWGRNGSYLVLRRLHQNLDGFRQFLQTAAPALAARHAALRDLTPDVLAAKLMGRWPSGAPLTRAPRRDDPELAYNSYANNDFRYVQPREALRGDTPEHMAARAYAPAPADDIGLICPHAAHVRRAYPRDDATAEISEAQIETHRLLRRGVPYGSAETPHDRGLLFMAYQTSIERQFEFITRGWLNNPHFRDSGDGYDPISGQHSEGRGIRERFCILPVRNDNGSVTRIRLELPFDLAIPTGGGYFFAPAISALRYLSTCRLPTAEPRP